MNILIVSSAPQSRCGIAKYAVQQAQALRAEGHLVDWASCDGGTEGVRHPLHLQTRSGWLKLLRIAHGYDRVIIHHQHDLYFRGLDARDISEKNALISVLFGTHRGVEVVAHEMLYALFPEGGVGRRVWMTELAKWRLCPKVVFHTRREMERFLALVPELSGRVELKEHHAEMQKHRDCSPAEARSELSVPAQAQVFLCIGFIQESKGFDRAVKAFRAVKNPNARLYLVGSVRVDDPVARRYLEKLRRLVDADERVTLVEGFVDDVAFDTWMIAADVIILPYRNIWSSGVAARARLFGRQLVATNVGGLEDQLKPGDVVVDTELELEDALVRLSSGTPVLREAIQRSRPGLRLAFVVPWYGDGIPGGAEAQARKTISHLVRAGVEVEVLTTCIQHYFSDWSVNARRPGVEKLDGVNVRRFKVQKRDAVGMNAVNAKVVARQPITAEEARLFENEIIKCPELIRYIEKNRSRYDFFVFIPYMFGTTIHGSRACPGQAVHIPCLHDEGYLDLECYRRMLTAARGILFNAPAERDLAVRRYGIKPEQYALTGEGIETDWTGDGEAFRERHAVRDYLVFVGRKDSDKNFPLLLEYYRRYRDERAHDLQLVVMGPGGVPFDAGDGDSIRDLGFVSAEEKHDAIAGALALVQPSVLESFSLTVMESWIAERPVLVHADCAVTRDHCLTSGGGLWFKSYGEFAACVDRLRADRDLADALGRAGRRYVLESYSWPYVISRYLDAFDRWKRPAAGEAPSPQGLTGGQVKGAFPRPLPLTGA